MKKLLFAAFVAAVAAGYAADVKSTMLKDGEFRIGCNYWASNAGMYMWRRWEPKTVEKDIAELAKEGVDIMRVFPLWPDFQPLTRLRLWSGLDNGIAQADGPLQNEAGVDEEMMRRFRFMCDVAEKHHVKLVVGLVTGWMSGRLFVPDALESRNVVTDPESVMWEVRFVRHFVREMKDHPAIIGWDLGNECNCLAKSDGYESWAWMNAIAGAIRLEDPSRPVVSGMHGGENDPLKSFSLVAQGELTDELTTHPYPLFTPNCSLEKFNQLRSETHPSCESLFYAGVSGKHCFVEEAGDLGRCTGSPERSAANVRASLPTVWASGLGAYVWWCGFDQQHLDFPPYTWNAVERELGLFTIDYQAKPVLKEFGAFRKFLDSLPKELKTLPPRTVETCVLVPELKAGRAWPAVHAAYMLAKQAGFEVSYARAERELPPAKLYILPAANITSTAWNRLLAKAEAGATVFISYGNGIRYSGIREATGNVIDYFYSRGRSFDFELKDFPGVKIAAKDQTTTGIIAEDSEVLAATAAGEPVVTARKLGKGEVLFCNFAIELNSAEASECFAGAKVNPRYLVYSMLAKRAGLRHAVLSKSEPNVGFTEHRLAEDRTVVVAVNYNDFPVKCEFAFDGRVGKVYRGSVSAGSADFPANDFVMFEVSR